MSQYGMFGCVQGSKNVGHGLVKAAADVELSWCRAGGASSLARSWWADDDVIVRWRRCRWLRLLEVIVVFCDGFVVPFLVLEVFFFFWMQFLLAFVRCDFVVVVVVQICADVDVFCWIFVGVERFDHFVDEGLVDALVQWVRLQVVADQDWDDHSALFAHADERTQNLQRIECVN